MLYIIIASTLLLIFLVALFVGFQSRKHGSPIGFTPAVASLVAFALATLAFSFTTVDPRAVAIVTGFGKYQGTLDSGIHFKAPWEKTEEFTTRLQSADLEGDEGVAVTFKGGGSGTVNATFRWSISDDQGAGGAKALWEKYKDFDTVSTTLVYREGKDAVLNVANDYTPNDARTRQDEIGQQIKDRMAERLKPYGVIVDSVSVLSMPLDERTQASLDKIVSSQNDVERAKADKERAKIDNETAELREKSGALSDGALRRLCLDVVNNWDVNKNGQLPATFDCGMSGEAKPGIIVNSK